MLALRQSKDGLTLETSANLIFTAYPNQPYVDTFHVDTLCRLLKLEVSQKRLFLRMQTPYVGAMVDYFLPLDNQHTQPTNGRLTAN